MAGEENPDLGSSWGLWTDLTETTALSDVGWNIPADGAGFSEFDRIEHDFSGSRDLFAPAPSISSNSSDDSPERSTAAAVAAAHPSPDTARRAKKKGQKRIRQQCLAFATKSEVDQLEDGYRWRKYGQKSVKNSPFPRSYYRCTNVKCMVKKRIERSSSDPTFVITTYEGQHNHYTAAFTRYFNFNFNFNFNPHLYNLGSSNTPRILTQLPTNAQQELGSEALVGEGLLGDIVPSGIRKG